MPSAMAVATLGGPLETGRVQIFVSQVWETHENACIFPPLQQVKLRTINNFLLPK